MNFMNEYDKELARIKSLFFKKIREFFDAKGFLEVEVPCMTPTVDPEPAMRHFETIFEDKYGGLANAIGGGGDIVGNFSGQMCEKYPMYLVTSPEFQMKKLLGAGFGDIYTLARVFRNSEAGGGRHNPEFTMLEWYRVGAGYEEMMDDTEALIKWLAGQPGLENFPGSKNLSRDRSWDRKSLNDLFIEYCGINLNENREMAELKDAAKKAGIEKIKDGGTTLTSGEIMVEGETFYDTNGCETWDDVMYKIFLNHIEPKLGFEKPIFVYNYPASQAALAKKNSDDPFWAERFELYINGNELCNGFSELTDSVEQRKRFEEQNKIREKEGRITFPVDEEFLSSLESIRLPCGGNALGTDRLLKVLLGKEKIEDVILFPLEKMLSDN